MGTVVRVDKGGEGMTYAKYPVENIFYFCY